MAINLDSGSDQHSLPFEDISRQLYFTSMDPYGTWPFSNLLKNVPMRTVQCYNLGFEK